MYTKYASTHRIESFRDGGASPKELNEQVAYEFAASQQYVAIAVWFDAETLPLLAAHFYRQAVEERNHAMMIVQFLLDSDHEVVIPAVEAPKTTFEDAGEPVALALDQEKRVTEQIAALAALAREENDLVGEQFLHWFLQEQREEVSSMSALLTSSSARRSRTSCSPRTTSPGTRSATRARLRTRHPPPAALCSRSLPPSIRRGIVGTGDDVRVPWTSGQSTGESSIHSGFGGSSCGDRRRAGTSRVAADQRSLQDDRFSARAGQRLGPDSDSPLFYRSVSLPFGDAKTNFVLRFRPHLRFRFDFDIQNRGRSPLRRDGVVPSSGGMMHVRRLLMQHNPRS